jgi:hypothetical protein
MLAWGNVYEIRFKAPEVCPGGVQNLNPLMPIKVLATSISEAVKKAEQDCMQYQNFTSVESAKLILESVNY